MATEKPPIGVSPWWFIYPKRVIELSEAISRYADFASKRTLFAHSTNDYKLIYQWAMEIAHIAETMAAMGGMQDET